ncbi:MAG TPA: exodeoxyribonuclease VII large subunit [Casimicrobiaceae bacterium]|jgi:exodeoxyribonuclease VII large subunit
MLNEPSSRSLTSPGIGIGTNSSPPVLPVSLLVSSARLLLERQLGLAWVAGEISDCKRAPSGHLYFKLKDAAAQVQCVFFRYKAQATTFDLKNGLAVEVRATPSIYEARGEFQLNVETIRLAGVGALYERFVKVKERLEAAGWFDEARKRRLPSYPRAIGIVTSTRAAALSDVLTTLRRRSPASRIVIYPASVQGDAAAPEIAAAIARANARREVDVLIVCRGGGSFEDLWPFNEEVVARAVLGSTLPIISGVGHETDFTICDFVADVRAPTPTAAATLAVPDRVALAHRLEQITGRITRVADHTLSSRIQRVDHASRRLIHPAARLAQQRERATALGQRIARAWRHRFASDQRAMAALCGRLVRELRAPLPQTAHLAAAIETWRRHSRERIARHAVRLDALAQSLVHLSPEAVLARGYALVTTRDGTVVCDAGQVAPSDAVLLKFAHGRAEATITRSEPS